MNSIKDLTPHQLRQAADIQERILGLQQELEQLLGAPGAPIGLQRVGKRRLSAQGLANIRAGARRRWARERGENGTGGVVRRRKMSAAGRARISAMLKQRWAAAKKSGRNAL